MRRLRGDGVAPLPGVSPQFTALPANPFAVAVSPGAEHAFVSMPREGSRGIVALSAGSPWNVERVLWVKPPVVPRGLTVDRTGRHLLVANGAGGLLVADTARLLAGDENPFAASAPAPATGSMQVALHADQRFAFVSDEDSATVSVFDFAGSLGSNAPAPVLAGQVRVPPGPVGLACSGDGQHLFVTSQTNTGGIQPGVVSVLTIEDLLAEPARAKVFSTPAGRTPVRVAVPPEGGVVWVTARGSDSLMAFDAARLIARESRALRAAVRVSSTPVGLVTIHGGSLVVVANSNRYGGGADEARTLSVVDAEAALAGRRAVIGTLPTGAFPRELAVLPDDQTVVVTNVFSRSLETISVAR